MSRSKSSKRWLQAHNTDPYVQQARQAGYRGRAIYKLMEIQQKTQILKPGQRVVDLGAAPGSWSQYVSQCLNHQGRIVALDRLSMMPIEGVTFFQGDFTQVETLKQLEDYLAGHLLDVVLSDMAPNASGCRAVDQPRAMELAELAFDFATDWLKAEGVFVVKLFHGEGFDDYIRQIKKYFKQVTVRKPKASKPQSRETYCIARHFLRTSESD